VQPPIHDVLEPEPCAHAVERKELNRAPLEHPQQVLYQRRAAGGVEAGHVTSSLALAGP
jgi:hypothetical protein